MLYKGSLVPTNALKSEILKLEYFWQPNEITKVSGNGFKNTGEKSNKELASYLGEVLKNLKNGETHKIADQSKTEILDEEFKNLPREWWDAQSYGMVIYEKVEDAEGNIYGKEILTGSLFPLDIVGSEESIDAKEYEIERTSSFSFGFDFKLAVKQNYNHRNFARITTILINNEIALPNEVEEYLTKFDTGFRHEKKKEAFIKKVIECSKTNTLIEEVEVFPIKPKKKEKKERESQNNITKVMENIEFLIQRLIKVKPEKAEEFSIKYENILNEKDFLNKSNISISSLVKLEAAIEFELMFTKGENTSLADKLEETKREYLSHFVTDNEEKTKMSLDELDKLMELFLKTKDDYSIIEQRKILKSFAGVYMLEVKEKEAEVTPERLEDSYFADLKKSIMLFINALIENGYVKNNMIVELSKEGSTEEILSLIRSLEFNKLSKEQAQELKLTI